jgi:hypothetical protein
MSRLKMLYGTAIGKQFGEVLGRMFDQGYYLEGVEVPAGPSDPDINCYLDALMYTKQGDKKEYFVVEIKTASGYGANLLADSFEPKEGYLAQLGVYLKDMHNKGITNRGMLLYGLLSDKKIGSLVKILCYYDDDTDEIVAYEGQNTAGETRSLKIRYRVGQVEERLVLLDKHLNEGQVPPPDFVYKYPVTAESVAKWSDNDLLKALRDGTVKGDWQVKYSPYKDLQLKTDGVAPGYSPEEITVIKNEKRRRTPNSKYVK